ncbi:integrase catalytic domain-containing protein [Ruegeria lacuscaerulensis]|uniref:integrase catalytic domain-containing protein n=1 Tax=Ruegeria lacuscaerulensis TaxID=55218 RepID=UPI00147A0E1F|nr:DDE-type integrase/transposase/recombinase [Ruegeria lacuscaerulensis]
MSIVARYSLERGTEVAFGNQELVLARMNEQGYEFVDTNTGEVAVTSFSKFAELLNSQVLQINRTGGLDSSVVELRLGSLKFAEQLAAPQRENGEFHHAICCAAAALRTSLRRQSGNPNQRLTGRLLNEVEHRKFICEMASEILGQKVRPSNTQGGRSKQWKLYAGRTILKYLEIYDSLSPYDDPIAALATREHLKGNRVRRIDVTLLDFMTQAWEKIGFDLKCAAPANVHAYLSTLIHEQNKIREDNGLDPLIVPSQKTLEAHRRVLLNPTEYLVATKGEKHARNKRGRGSTDFRALIPGELGEIDECKLSLVTSAKERGYWERLSEGYKQTLEDIDNEIRERLTLLVMIDVASRMPLAWVLSDKPKAEATKALLRMATRDKTKEKIKYGCEGDPAPAMGLGNIKSDNGTGLRNTAVISSVVGMGSLFNAVRTYSPTDKTYVERVFGTTESALLKLLHGYTGRRAGELPGYDAKANGVLDIEELRGILTRFFIDEYPSRRHYGTGMGGRRPAEVFKDLNKTRGLFRPIDADERRIHLGWKQDVKPNDEGVRVFGGIYYNSDEFQRLVDDYPGTKTSVFVDPENASEATAVIPGSGHVVRLQLQVTAFMDMTIPEIINVVEAHRREAPEVTVIHEDRIASTRRKLFDKIDEIGVESNLPRSFSTAEEAVAKSNHVFAGARILPTPEPVGSVSPGEIGPNMSGSGVRMLGGNPQERSLQDNDLAHEAPKKPSSKRDQVNPPALNGNSPVGAQKASYPKRSKDQPIGRPKIKGKFR